MAVSDKEAKKLKLTASQRKSTKGAIKITKPDSKKDALKDERFNGQPCEYGLPLIE